MCSGNWRMQQDGKEVVFNAPETAAAMAKAMTAARFPHSVEANQVSALLDTAEAHKHDTIQQVWAMSPPLSLFCSLCARNLGDNLLAERFAQSELVFNLNPVKQQRSHMSLALAHCLIPQQKREGEEE